MSIDRPVLYVAEPSASYVVRPPLVVDCSVLIAVLFEEETYDQAMGMMNGKALFAPNLLPHEIINVALKKNRAGCSLENTRQALYSYAANDIELLETDARAQYELAQRYNLSGYDAAYLWLAAELKAPLATFDKKLADAAKSHLASLP